MYTVAVDAESTNVGLESLLVATSTNSDQSREVEVLHEQLYRSYGNMLHFWYELQDLHKRNGSIVHTAWHAMSNEQRRRILDKHLGNSSTQPAHVLPMISRGYFPFDCHELDTTLMHVVDGFNNAVDLAQDDNFLTILDARAQNSPLSFLMLDAFVASCAEIVKLPILEHKNKIKLHVGFEQSSSWNGRLRHFERQVPDEIISLRQLMSPLQATELLVTQRVHCEVLGRICSDLLEHWSTIHQSVHTRQGASSKHQHTHELPAFVASQMIGKNNLMHPKERFFRGPMSFRIFTILSLFEARLEDLLWSLTSAKDSPRGFYHLLKSRVEVKAKGRMAPALWAPSTLQLYQALRDIDLDIFMWQQLFEVASTAHLAYKQAFHTVTIGKQLEVDLNDALLHLEVYLKHHWSRLHNKIIDVLHDAGQTGQQTTTLVNTHSSENVCVRQPLTSEWQKHLRSGNWPKAYCAFVWLTACLINVPQDTDVFMWTELILTELLRLLDDPEGKRLFPSRLSPLLIDFQAINLALSELVHFAAWSSRHNQDHALRRKYELEVQACCTVIPDSDEAKRESPTGLLHSKIRLLYTACNQVPQLHVQKQNNKKKPNTNREHREMMELRDALQFIWVAVQELALPNIRAAWEKQWDSPDSQDRNVKLQAKDLEAARHACSSQGPMAPMSASASTSRAASALPGAQQLTASSAPNGGATNGHNILRNHHNALCGRTVKRREYTAREETPASVHVPQNKQARTQCSDAASTADDRSIIVDHRSLATFASLFTVPKQGYGSALATKAGLLPTNELERALTHIGFSKIPVSGSIATFALIDHQTIMTGESKSITLHGKHKGGATYSAKEAYNIGRRLNKRFGWTYETFCLKR